jgi:hypothetical protein
MPPRFSRALAGDVLARFFVRFFSPQNLAVDKTTQRTLFAAFLGSLVEQCNAAMCMHAVSSPRHSEGRR